MTTMCPHVVHMHTNTQPSAFSSTNPEAREDWFPGAFNNKHCSPPSPDEAKSALSSILHLLHSADCLRFSQVSRGEVRGQMESSDTTLCWEIIKIGAFLPEMSDLSVSPQLTRYFSTLHFSLALLRKFTNLNSTSQKTFTEHQFYAMHCTGGCRYKGDSETDFRFQVTVKRGRQAAGQIISMQCDIC